MDVIDGEGVTCLYLNYALGWQEDPTLAFLAEVSGIQSLWVVGREEIDPTAVQHLHSLRVLKIDGMLSRPIDFSRLPRLEEFAGYWRGGMETIFEAEGLTRLRLIGYPEKAIQPFTKLEALEFLALYSAKITNLAGIDSLPLRSLTLAHCSKLTTVSPVADLHDLEELQCESCRKIGSLPDVSQMLGLRTLIADNCSSLASLRPVAGHQSLETVRFMGDTTIVDGDLTPLHTLPKLRNLGFVNRRHYRPSWKSFNPAFFQTRYSILWG